MRNWRLDNGSYSKKIQPVCYSTIPTNHPFLVFADCRSSPRNSRNQHLQAPISQMSSPAQHRWPHPMSPSSRPTQQKDCRLKIIPSTTCSNAPKCSALRRKSGHLFWRNYCVFASLEVTWSRVGILYCFLSHLVCAELNLSRNLLFSTILVEACLPVDCGPALTQQVQWCM